MKEHASPVFEWLQQNCRGLMTLVDRLPLGELYHYDQSGFALPAIWVCLGEQTVLVAYSENESRPLIAEKLERWSALLGEGKTPAEVGDYSAVFAATRDDDGTELRVGWLRGGDWMGLVGRSDLPRRASLLPHGWPESYRARIAELAKH